MGSTPRTTRVTKIEQPSRPRIGAWSSMVTSNARAKLSATCAPPLAGNHVAGSRNAAPVSCEYSRATPRIEKAYPRSGVTLMSTAESSRASRASASEPSSGSRPSSPRRMMPEWSSPKPSSLAEASMPSETWPYVLRAAISKPPGKTAPGSVTTTLSPATKFFAPQTIPRTSGWPDESRPTST